MNPRTCRFGLYQVAFGFHLAHICQIAQKIFKCLTCGSFAFVLFYRLQDEPFLFVGQGKSPRGRFPAYLQGRFALLEDFHCCLKDFVPLRSGVERLRRLCNELIMGVFE